MIRTAAHLVLGVGAGLIGASLISRYLNWILDFSITQGIRDWNSFGGTLPSAAALVTFMMIFGAVMGAMKK